MGTYIIEINRIIGNCPDCWLLIADTMPDLWLTMSMIDWIEEQSLKYEH